MDCPLLKICNGRGDNGNHCCYVDGKVCRFLTHVGDTPRCTLRLYYNSWEEVHEDSGYLKYVKPSWERCGASDCGIFGTGLDGKQKECCFKDK